MAKPTVKPTPANKQKHGRPAKTGANKKAKTTWALTFLSRFLTQWWVSTLSYESAGYFLFEWVFCSHFSSNLDRFSFS